VPVVQHVEIVGSAACDSCWPTVCPGVPMRVVVSGVLPNPCWSLVRLAQSPATSSLVPPRVIATFRTPCDGSSRCTIAAPTPFRDSIDIAPVRPGSHVLHVSALMQLCADTTQSMGLAAAFGHYMVADSCPVASPAQACVWPFLDPLSTRADSAGACHLTLRPGGEGELTFAARADGVPLAGLQGGFTASPNLHFTGMTTEGVAGPMHLTARLNPDGSASFVLYADHGAPIPAGAMTMVLNVNVRADSALAGTATTGWVAGGVTAASDSLGNSVPICPIQTFREVVASVCIARTPDCDVNGDGFADVADLVRMARCWFRPETCADSLAARPDCNGDGAFHVDDILCCARTMLGGGRRDTLPPPPPVKLRVALGGASALGDLLRVPLQIHGATEMNGALLHVRYPADRYVAVSAEAANALLARSAAVKAVGSDAWLPLVELGSDDMVVGVLRLDTVAPEDVEVPLYFRLKPGQSPGGDVVVDQGSVMGANGTDLGVDLSGTNTPLPGGLVTNPITRVELLVGPNPSTGTTRFVVRLPRAGLVDLSLFDLAGRRVTTLVHGTEAAGERTVTWDATGARSGLYFARLSVDGEVRTTRVALQLAR
jgi:hypothetical protein